MKISDEAVQAAARKDAEMSGRTFDALSSSEKKRYLLRSQEQLTAALPFLQGVKVKALEWVEIPACNGMNTAKTQFGTYTIGSSLVVRYGLKSVSKPLATLEAAKSAAQADYEARILSAIEVSPSPRAQALEEAASDIVDAIFKDLRDRRFLKWIFDERGDNCLIGYFHSGEALRGIDLEAQREIRKSWEAIIDSALSSQPVADHVADAGKMVVDGWLPIATAPKDGSFIDLWHVNNTRVPKCRWFTNSSGYTAWHVQQGGRACNMGGDQMFTHWRHLPASPGASE